MTSNHVAIVIANKILNVNHKLYLAKECRGFPPVFSFTVGRNEPCFQTFVYNITAFKIATTVLSSQTLEIKTHRSISPQTTEELRIQGAIEKKPRFGILSKLSWLRFGSDKNGYLITMAKNPPPKKKPLMILY